MTRKFKKEGWMIKNRVQITRRMLADPDSWPNFPVLPLKRETVVNDDGKITRELGVILYGSENFGHGITAMTVFHMNMLEFAVLETNDSIVELVSTKEFDVFDTTEDLVKSGWVVD